MKKSYSKWFLTKVKKAVRDFDMIQNKDRIGIGVSGGKDSIALLFILDLFRKYSHLEFSIHAVSLDLGWGVDYTPLIEFCKNRDIPLHIEKTDIGEIVFYHRKEKNPCSLCSKMRGGALNNVVKQLDCNVVALGHHADDAIETLLLNMIFTGKLGAFQPKIFLDRSGLTLIRPLVYLHEDVIISLVKSENLPIIDNPCPASGVTKREDIKNLIDMMEEIFPSARANLLSSLSNVVYSGLWMKEDKDKS
ncbi:MAG TPA: tRNA 2-thiocytidine(32) synthetase TtcA [Thermoanaerobacterales bacterium]|nr:tRNA 2-thiocytidine(32) synthetase TtcA [Thermoanaerobacterales bacterium]